jgi:hypothetical protein
MADERTLDALLHTVGAPTVFSVLDDVETGGKLLKVELLNAPPVREESPPAAHSFHDVPGFSEYLKTYGTKALVIWADVPSGRIKACLNEKAETGRELVEFMPVSHPLFAPWAAAIGKRSKLEDFIKLLRENRRSVSEPDARELILGLSQLTATTEIKVHKGQGNKCLNGLLVRSTIQGVVKDEIVELPDSLTLHVPLYLGRAAIDFKIDLLIEADQQGNVLVGLSSGDLLEAVFNTFVDMTGELKGLLKGAGTFTMGRPAYGAWAYQK